MANYAKLDLGDGMELFIQTVEPQSSGTHRPASAGMDTVVKNGQDIFDKALPSVKQFAMKAKDVLQKDVSPDELELSFSVGFNTDLNAFITSAGANASMGVKLKWKNQKN
nr:hypothetical protein [Oscillospiraceae bacterium]